MKRLITTTLLCFGIAMSTHAQASLEFGQVVLLTSTEATNPVLGTVPTGKVWKVESFGGAQTSTVVVGMLNGAHAGYLQRSSTGSFAQNSWTLPVWLPAGTQLGFMNNTDGALVWFSILEFNHE